MGMRKTVIVILLSLIFNIQADLKEVLLKVPKRFDTVIKVNVEGLKKVKALSGLFKGLPNSSKSLEELQKQLGFDPDIINTIYICSNFKQFFDEKGMPKKENDIGNLIQKGHFDLLIFAELNKALDTSELAKNMPKDSQEYTMNDTKCFKISNKQFKNINVILFKDKLIGLAPEFAVKDLLSDEKTDTILRNKKTVELLKENGFGGLISVLHSGIFIKVPEMTPWLKEYRGSVLNLWFSEKDEVEIEYTLNFQTLEAVKNAYTLTTLGMNFLESRPDLQDFKNGIKIKVNETNLLIDIKIKPKLFTNVINGAQTQLSQARGKALKAKSKSNQRQLSMGIIVYTSKNKGKLPDNIEDIAKYIGGKEAFDRLMVCPVTGNRYSYVKPVDNINDSENPSEDAILFSKTTDGTITAFLDGHVEIKKNSRGE